MVKNMSSKYKYNYFVANLTGDSRIWISDNGGTSAKVLAFNDDYEGDGNYEWGLKSRVLKDLPKDVGYIQVSAYSSYTPTGNCDLYAKVSESFTTYLFPKLDRREGMRSAPDDDVNKEYNCGAWAGGMTEFEWPVDIESDYCVKKYSQSGYAYCDPLPSFDKYFESARYVGAMEYERTSINDSEGLIDLWYSSGYGYSHTSVGKYANNHAHGFDYESKIGTGERIFHPRHSLEGDMYGNVKYSYKPKKSSGLKSAILLDESIARGLSVVETIELTNEEENIIEAVINNIPSDQKLKLEEKYNAWKETWSYDYELI